MAWKIWVELSTNLFVMERLLCSTTTTKLIFFSSACWAFTKIEHTLSQKTKLSKFQRTKIYNMYINQQWNTISFPLEYLKFKSLTVPNSVKNVEHHKVSSLLTEDCKMANSGALLWCHQCLPKLNRYLP